MWHLHHIDHILADQQIQSELSVTMTSRVYLYIIFISLSLSNHALSPNSELTELPELYAIPRMLHRVALFCKNNFVLYFKKNLKDPGMPFLSKRVAIFEFS